MRRAYLALMSTILLVLFSSGSLRANQFPTTHYGLVRSQPVSLFQYDYMNQLEVTKKEAPTPWMRHRVTSSDPERVVQSGQLSCGAVACGATVTLVEGLPET